MKRMSTASREENYEHVLMCLICRSLFDDHDHQPKFLPCHHTFCKDCLREYVHQTGEDVECPSCRKVATIPTAGVSALQTNFYIKYIQNLVHGGPGGDGRTLDCGHHPGKVLKYFCKECSRSVCDMCCAPTEKTGCAKHKRTPLTTVTEEYHQKLDKGFAKTNAVIECKRVEVEAMLKALSHEKDQALLKIDSTFEQHAHTLNRRTTLLKNKVIDIYNEHVSKLEADLEEISTAMTCIVSLKEYHENAIASADFGNMDSGLFEMEEVHNNIADKIHPEENHIMFEDKQGVDKFKVSVRDLGRVRSSRPSVPRSEPEGNDSAQQSPITMCADSPSNLSVDSPGITTESSSDIMRLSAMSRSSGSKDLLQQGAPQPMSTSFHSQLNPVPKNNTLMMSSTDNLTDKKQAPTTTAESTPPQSAQTDKAPVEGTVTDTPQGQTVEGDKPVMVVRPKTLNTTTLLSKRPDMGNISRAAKIKPITNAAILSMQAKLGSGLQEDWTLEDSQNEDSNANKLEQDKRYHHLVYTSYDEEELLRELQAGKIQADQHRAQDGWMTVSSDSTLSGTSETSENTTQL